MLRDRLVSRALNAKGHPMFRHSISYTLAFPGQNYEAVREVLRLVSRQFAHVDESQFLVETPYSARMVELLLSAVMDQNDQLLVLTVSDSISVNYAVEWVSGAQAAPVTKLAAGRIIQQLRVAALKQRRLRA